MKWRSMALVVKFSRVSSAATTALQGLAGGNLAGALAGASAPELAHLLKSTEKYPAVNAIAHAILGGAAAAMQGNNVAAGQQAPQQEELAARAIAGMLYPGVKQSDLSEEQKQTISTLATVSAGLAGGLPETALHQQQWEHRAGRMLLRITI